MGTEDGAIILLVFAGTIAVGGRAGPSSVCRIQYRTAICLQRVPREYSTTSRTTVSRMIPRTVNSVRKTRRYCVCTISTGTQDAERDTWWDSKKLRTTAVTQSKNQTRTNCNRADTINPLLTLFCS